MRVAIHYKDGSVAAYKFGRIEDGVTNVHPITGDRLGSVEEIAQQLLEQAAREFPNAQVTLERMVMHPEGIDEGVWIPKEEFDPQIHTPVGAGNSTQPVELHAQQEARA